jgi:hypothetical protein
MSERNQEDILTKYWWEHNRFEFFGLILNEKLSKDSKLK